MARRGLPTWYGGIEFRSRLEARYALFFDELHLKWEYETQGFESDGQRYLPDFLLFAAAGTIWVEVKPTWVVDPGEIEKFRRFAIQRPMPSRGALLTGPPSATSAALVIGGSIDAEDPAGGPWEDDSQTWRWCPGGQHFDLTQPGMFGSRLTEDGCEHIRDNDGELKIIRAATVANSAKFLNGPDGRR